MCGSACGPLCAGATEDPNCISTCDELQAHLCDSVTLSEAPAERSEVAEPLAAKPVVAKSEDFPVPIDSGSHLWQGAVDSWVSSLAAINAQRQKLSLAALPPGSIELLHAWVRVESREGFKFCVRATLVGEQHYIVVDEAGGVVTGVAPARLLFGDRFAYEQQEALERAHDAPAALEAPETNFPCTAEFSKLIAVARGRLGLRLGGVSALAGRSFRRGAGGEAALPTNYDAHEAWPECALPARDQGSCGSCYAFAAAAVAGERLCIAREKVRLSSAGELDGHQARMEQEAHERQVAQLHSEIEAASLELQAAQARHGELQQQLEAVHAARNAGTQEDSFLQLEAAQARHEELQQQLAALHHAARHAGTQEDSFLQLPPSSPMLTQGLAAASQARRGQRGAGKLGRGLRGRTSVLAPPSSPAILSPQELVSCGSADRPDLYKPYCTRDPEGRRSRKYTNGCDGGTPFDSLYYVHRYGLPTKECVPYTSGGSGDFTQHFELGAGKVPLCAALEQRACHAGRAQHRLHRPEVISDGDVESIMQVIYEGGPVYATMDVYEDFMNEYPSGYDSEVYVKRPGKGYMGGHALIIDGWGVTSTGLPYWHGRNSWGSAWGREGLFRMRRGTNEVGIEDGVHFAQAVVEGEPAGVDASNAGSECVAVEQVGDSCSLTNVCETQVRSVRVSYFGSEVNCGGWEQEIPGLYPGDTRKHVIPNAYVCTVVADNYVTDFDTQLFYEDVTEQYPGYACVLQNTFSGQGTRIRWCGQWSVRVARGGVAAVSRMMCEAGCREAEGQSVLETTA